MWDVNLDIVNKICENVEQGYSLTMWDVNNQKWMRALTTQEVIL